MENKISSQPITNLVDESRLEILLMALKFSSTNHLSVSAMTDLLRLINNIFRTPILPESKYMIDKLLNSAVGVNFHAVCNTCSAYIGEFTDVQETSDCLICNSDVNLKKTSNTNFFVLIDPTMQVSDLIHMHENYYDYTVKERVHEKDIISDVYDGNKYRKFVKSLPEEEKYSYVTCVLNTDGAPIYKSSKYSVWPLFLKLNELPKQDRINNLVLAGLWFNKKKPEMTVFLRKFVELLM